MDKDILIIMDPGHGGLDKGKYVTAPNKMHVFEDGFTVYEGVFNRDIVKKICYVLKSRGIPNFNLVPGPQDTPLPERVAYANELVKKYNGRAIYISVHANAGGGTGFEVYTSKGETKSDKIADFYIESMIEEFPDQKARVDTLDGDFDKEANFYVLKHTACPAILTESFFMDKREDAELMRSYAGQMKIVNAHLKTIDKALSAGIFDAPKEAPRKKPAPSPASKTVEGPKAKAPAKPKAKAPAKPKTPTAKADNTNVSKPKPKPRTRKFTKK